MGGRIDDLKVLKTAETLADEVWDFVVKWEPFAKDTIGKQLTRAADSVGANIAEAYGRYHYGEKLQFLYYARGSLFETKYWLNRASQRHLLPTQRTDTLTTQIQKLIKELNGFVHYLKQQQRDYKTTKRSRLKEETEIYNTTPITEPKPFFTPKEQTFLTTNNHNTNKPIHK